MIAPTTIEALSDVARALGFTLICRDGVAVPAGIDAVRAAEQRQYALLLNDEVQFDGTARECSAFLIGWRDLRSRGAAGFRGSRDRWSRVPGGLRLQVLETQVLPEMSGYMKCGARDAEGRSCLACAGHKDLQHTALVRWEDPR